MASQARSRDVNDELRPELARLLTLTTGPRPEAEQADVQQCRSIVQRMDREVAARLGPVEDALEETSLEIPISDDFKSLTRICRPKTRTGTQSPLIVLYYGMGFTVGSPASMVAYARGLCRIFHAVVVCPSYRLAPEHKFPFSVEDAWQALVWCTENAETLQASLQKGFIVGGTCTGANIAAVLARRAVAEDLKPCITGLWLSGLPIFVQETVPSGFDELWRSTSRGQEPLAVSQADEANYFEHYAPDFKSKLFNPLAHDWDTHKFPPVYSQVASMESIRHDGIVYDIVLGSAGVRTRLDVYPGLPQSFWYFMPQLAQSKKAIVDIAEGFAWLLKMKIDSSTVHTQFWIPNVEE